MTRGVPFAAGTLSAGLSHTQLCTLLEWVHALPQLDHATALAPYLEQLTQQSGARRLWLTHGRSNGQGWQETPQCLGQVPTAFCPRSHEPNASNGVHMLDCTPLQDCDGLGVQRDGFATQLFVELPDDSVAELRMLAGVLPHLHAVLQRLLATPSGNDNPLSHRERDIFHWMMRGKTNWEIATILDISERTVKFHAANIIRKLEANNRTHAIVLGIQKGLLA